MHPVDYLPAWLSETLFWVYYNQTLIAGLGALCGAWWTIRIIRRQIKLSDEHERDRVRRTNRKNRALLPQALSDMKAYVVHCATTLREMNDNDGTHPPEQTWDRPTLPREALIAIGNSIETAEATNSKRLAGILASAQVQNARFGEAVRSGNSNITQARSGFQIGEIHTHAYDLVGLSKLLDCAYDYGRGQSNLVHPICDAAEARNAPLFLLNMEDEDLKNLIERQWPPSFHDFAEEEKDW